MPSPTQDEEIDRILLELLPPAIAGLIKPDGLRKLIDTNGSKRDRAKAALHRLMLKERLKQTRRILQHEVDVWKVSRNRSYLESEIKELKAGIAELSSQIEGSKSDE